MSETCRHHQIELLRQENNIGLKVFVSKWDVQSKAYKKIEMTEAKSSPHNLLAFPKKQCCHVLVHFCSLLRQKSGHTSVDSLFTVLSLTQFFLFSFLFSFKQLSIGVQPMLLLLFCRCFTSAVLFFSTMDASVTTELDQKCNRLSAEFFNFLSHSHVVASLAFRDILPFELTWFTSVLGLHQLTAQTIV